MKSPVWRKPSRSNTQGNQCVEVANLGPGGVGVRDSKAPEKGHLTFAAADFLDLVVRIKANDLDV